MKLLILGGTVFLGRHLVEAALARGDAVTLFNRGEHNPDLYPTVEKLRGDRDGGLDVLKGKEWDAAIDTCGYVPRLVRASASLLRDSVEHYTFISSLSVYSESDKPHQDETAPVGALDDPKIEEVTAETYGPLKALCEQVAEEAMPGRVLNVRAGLIVGPYDVSDRFTYWPHRVALGGEVLAPGSPSGGVQLIDARDLAEWVPRMAESKQAGVYNATGPARSLTMREVLNTSKEVSGIDARFTWVSETFLQQNGVQPWTEMPLWIPGEDAIAFSTTDCAKAIGAGLTFRLLSDTVAATLEWDKTRPADREWRAGITAEREAELLRLWHAAEG